MTEPKILVPEGSTAPEAEMEGLPASPKITVPTALVIEPSALAFDLFKEQPSLR